MSKLRDSMNHHTSEETENLTLLEAKAALARKVHRAVLEASALLEPLDAAGRLHVSSTQIREQVAKEAAELAVEELEQHWKRTEDHVPAFDAAALGKAMLQKRTEMGLDVRTVTSYSGLSPSTHSRIERGTTPDLETYIKACQWLGVGLEAFVV